MVERDINWINQRWFNLGIGTESMVELHFTCVDLRFVISRLNPMLRLGGKKKITQAHSHCYYTEINFKSEAFNKIYYFCMHGTNEMGWACGAYGCGEWGV